ncbi:MAG: hypothetical protein F6J87_27760 [Spirulina sp. SIO3F2]|nr:hypothetical protein [Spirulina sp. SIO3F2]
MTADLRKTMNRLEIRNAMLSLSRHDRWLLVGEMLRSLLLPQKNIESSLVKQSEPTLQAGKTYDIPTPFNSHAAAHQLSALLDSESVIGLKYR